MKEKPLAHIRQGGQEQALSEHLLAVAKRAKHYAGAVSLSSAGYLLGLLHDFGKYSEQFQKYIRSGEGLIDQDSDDFVDPIKNKGRIDHSTAGSQHIWNYYLQYPKCTPYAQMLALCIASHHSGLIDCLNPDGEDVFMKRMEKDDEKTFLSECLQRGDTSILQALQASISPKIVQEVHNVLKNMGKRCVENASKDSGNSFEIQRGLLTRFLLSCLIDADHTDSAEFEDPKQAQARAAMPHKAWDLLCQRMEEHLQAFPVRHDIDKHRQKISNHCAQRAKDAQGIFTLTVPTGGGKTLASLRFALQHAKKHNLERIIYIIPYTSIIEQNADVARKILEPEEERGNIVLEHHSNILPEKETWQNQLLSSNWDAPVVFTTMVQFLESIFASGTRNARRMHNLSRAVLIFDEVQTVPIHCVRLFCEAVKFFVHSAQSTAVLCTATQPRFDYLPLQAEQEIAPHVSELFQNFRRVNFFDHCHTVKTVEEISALTIEEMRLTGSCLVVCNTKKIAEKLCRLCQEEQDNHEVYYLSTNLCPAHRFDQLNAITSALQEKKSVICISTQLIECGVDISFGSVIRFAAGLDSILQSAGRCNRHGECEIGRVHIVNLPLGEEKLGSLEDIEEGQRIFLERIHYECAELLQEIDYDLTQPQIIDKYFFHYLYERKDRMDYLVNIGRDDSLINLLGCNERTAKSSKYNRLPQSFKTAAEKFSVINAPTQGIIVPYGKGKDIIADLRSSDMLYKKKELLRKAQRYTVNVYPHFLRQLQSADIVRRIQNSDIWELNGNYYAQDIGIVLENQLNMALLNY